MMLQAAKIGTNGVLLMFSGGRDSTLAAVRLARTYERLVLATVTSEHLIGYDRVEQRLHELKPHLPPATRCVRVLQPTALSAETLRQTTCLPCHREYVTTGVSLAKQQGIADLAFGYVRYQNTWPEQTEYATTRLSHMLNRLGMRLRLPVYDIATRGEALSELAALNMSAEALEQKCLQQQRNEELPNGALETEIDIWERSTNAQLIRVDEISLTVVSDVRLDELR